MEVFSNELVCGYPVKQVRKLMRKAQESFFTERDVMDVMRIKLPAARKLIKQLDEEGYIEQLELVNGWRTMMRGVVLAATPVKQMITREAADEKIAGLIERVKQVNDDPYFLYAIVSVYAYGDYAEDTQELRRLNVAVKFEAREKDRNKHVDLIWKKKFRKSKSFWNMIERLEYPRTEICELLKSGVHGLEVRQVGEVDYLKDVKVREVFTVTNN